MHNTLAEQLTGEEVDPRQVLSPYWFGISVKYGSGPKPYRMWHESRSGKGLSSGFGIFVGAKNLFSLPTVLCKLGNTRKEAVPFKVLLFWVVAAFSCFFRFFSTFFEGDRVELIMTISGRWHFWFWEMITVGDGGPSI